MMVGNITMMPDPRNAIICYPMDEESFSWFNSILRIEFTESKYMKVPLTPSQRFLRDQADPLKGKRGLDTLTRLRMIEAKKYCFKAEDLPKVLLDKIMKERAQQVESKLKEKEAQEAKSPSRRTHSRMQSPKKVRESTPLAQKQFQVQLERIKP